MVDYNTVYNTRKGLTTHLHSLFVKLSEDVNNRDFICIHTDNTVYLSGAIYQLEEGDFAICCPENSLYYKTALDTKCKFGFVVYEYFMAKKKAKILESLKVHKMTDYHFVGRENILRDKVRFLEDTLFDLLETL